MIYGIFHQGSGLGNQLHRYVATRVKALGLGVDWKMIYHPDGSGKESGFKGKGFINIEQPKEVVQIEHFVAGERPNNELNVWNEKCVRDDICGVDIRSYDPEFNFIEDNTIIDGEFQDERYWENYERDVDEWLRVEPIEIPDDVCLIGFRGGEFAVYTDLFLEKEYWDKGIEMMRKINPNMRFEVHTDDEVLARQCFPDFKVIHDMEINWRSMRCAKYAIIANSSFFIFPRWLRNGYTIAPRYWGRHNTKVWSLPQNYYKRFAYI